MLEHPQWKKNLEYVLNNYSNNIWLKEAFQKAKTYWKNREKYKEPEDNYDEYRYQPVEEESFRRWDLVVEEYKKIINQNPKSKWNIVIPAWKFKSPDFRIDEDWTIHRKQKEDTQEDTEEKSKIDELLYKLNENNKDEIIEQLRNEINILIENEENTDAKDKILKKK